jgi:hypothetical protein
MTFVNSGLLWLLPLAALPIILHLLTLFRLRTVELSTYRFLFDSYLQQRRRMKLLEALLAMLRTLFLLVLVLVIARPMVRHWSDLFQTGSGGREVLLLMDCSAGMEAQTAGVSAFERAKTAARAVVKRLDAEDRVTLVRVAARPQELFSRFSTDAAGIDDRIDSLKTTPARANFYAAFTQLFGPEAPKRRRPVVYLFTDCQAGGWNEVRNQGLERVLPPETQLTIVNVGSTDLLPNQAVIGDAPPRQRAVVGLPVRFTARVVNHAKEPAEVTLRTFVDEKEIARHRLAVKAGEMTTKKVFYTPSEAGVHRGRFEISGNRSDRFPADDSYLFTLAAVPRVKVLVVNGNPSADPETDEALYLKALSDIFADAPGDKKPGKDSGPAASLRRLARSLDLREIQEAGITAKELQDAGVVVLANCGGLTDAHFTLLRDFVSAGGGLLVFPGDKVNPEVYNTRFFPVPGVEGEFLTPVQLGPPQGDPEKLDTFDHLAAIDFSHPVLSVFDDPQRKEPYFKNVLIYRRFPLKLPDKKAKIWPLAEFGTGGLALVENQGQEGEDLAAGGIRHGRAGPGGEPVRRRPGGGGGLPRQPQVVEPAHGERQGVRAVGPAPHQPRPAPGRTGSEVLGGARRPGRDLRHRRLEPGRGQGLRPQGPLHRCRPGAFRLPAAGCFRADRRARLLHDRGPARARQGGAGRHPGLCRQPGAGGVGFPDARQGQVREAAPRGQDPFCRCLGGGPAATQPERRPGGAGVAAADLPDVCDHRR